MSNFHGATVTITGGTGSFGKTMVKALLNEGVDQINILSRDEAKQDEMRHATWLSPCGYVPPSSSWKSSSQSQAAGREASPAPSGGW